MVIGARTWERAVQVEQEDSVEFKANHGLSSKHGDPGIEQVDVRLSALSAIARIYVHTLGRKPRLYC
jgi:hypothetical protein